MSDSDDPYAWLDEQEENLRAPFGYHGNKYASLRHILPNLPLRKVYVEVFGGSGVVLLNRRKSELEVFNDKYSGVYCFYRVIQSLELLERLTERVSFFINSREWFYDCKESWMNCTDLVERAARWWYMVSMSFGRQGDTWGFSTHSPAVLAQSLRRRIPVLGRYHERMCDVQLENRDFREILKRYDSPETVFYLDPPYIETTTRYEHLMSVDQHADMLEIIKSLKGYVALSGPPTVLYDSVGFWNRVETWSVAEQCDVNVANRGKRFEKLWIKEAR